MNRRRMEIRELTEEDATSFYSCMKAIDHETQYMMLEQDERVWNEDFIKREISDKNNLLIGAIEDGEVIGFLSAERGKYRRNCHSAYVVIGIRKAYCHKGIGTQLFSKLDEWARINCLTRLELTVETPNVAAINLYKKCGFVVEGTKKYTMLVNGNYVDEYMMAKVFR